MKYWKGSLVFILISWYNILIASVALYFSIDEMLFAPGISMAELFIKAILICLYMTFLVTNLMLIFNAESKLFPLRYIQVFTLLQVVHFKIAGFIFQFIVGPMILFYFQSLINFGIQWSIMHLTCNILYSSIGEGFFVGLNLPALLISIYYYQFIKRLTIFNNINLKQWNAGET